MADSLLRRNYYEPNPASDMWATGLLMVGMVGGHIPEAHTDLHQNPALRLDVATGKRRWHQSIAMQRYYAYLQNLLKQDFSEQVTTARLVHQ